MVRTTTALRIGGSPFDDCVGERTYGLAGPKVTAGRPALFASAFAVLSLALSQLDASVDGLELHARSAGPPDMGAQMLRVQPAADRHLEVRVQRAVHRRQIDVAAE